MSYDTIVIGAGYAGLTAALKLAQGGHKVLLLAKGYGATHLRTGTIDLLGYAANQRVTKPLEVISTFTSSRPDHPYAMVSEQTIRDAATFFVDAMTEAEYPFDGSVETNLLMPTAMGAARPVAFVPRTMRAGNLQAGHEFVIVGFSNFKDFYPELIADNLQRSVSGLHARAISLVAPGLEKRPDLLPMDLARAFDQDEFRRKLVAILKPQLKPGERVGFPAVLGIDRACNAFNALQTSLGAEIFEIPTLPPSVAGIRIFRAFDSLLRKRGVRVQIGHAVGQVQVQGKHVDAVVVETVVRPVVYRAQHFVLATGGMVTGGLQVDSHGQVSEPLFGLPVMGIPASRDAYFSTNYFDEHALNHIGLAVDGQMRPLDASAQPVFDNLRVCGTLLANSELWKEKSAEGISLTTAYQAAKSILASQS